jgi:hypothetical protein
MASSLGNNSFKEHEFLFQKISVLVLQDSTTDLAEYFVVTAGKRVTKSNHSSNWL